MKFMSLLAVAFSLSALANSNDLAHMPKPFSTPNGKAVFVDFSEAIYNITYDVTQKKAYASASITFTAPEAGLPVFDSVTAPTSITLDGSSVTAVEVETPERETKLRTILKPISVGTHRMVIELPITELIEFVNGGVKSAFWTSDLAYRQFLERYLPANFEFDQVKMTYNVKFIGAADQIIYTNGVMTTKQDGTISIAYPSYYTSSSVFFHTTPKADVKETRYSLKSIDGREIPVVIYASTKSWGVNLDALKAKTSNVFYELEKDYGAFPHPSITVYNSGSGGMEYCGATITSSSALGHELFHSYFARGMMPANGNSGWLDEALASWRDDGYPRSTTMSGSSMMSAHPYYTRMTDRDAYTFGARFMSYLDGKFQDKGGLKMFMRHVIENRVFQPLFVEEFTKEISEFYGVAVHEDFKRFTYGKQGAAPFVKSSDDKSHHHKMSLEDLKKAL